MVKFPVPPEKLKLAQPKEPLQPTLEVEINEMLIAGAGKTVYFLDGIKQPTASVPVKLYSPAWSPVIFNWFCLFL